MADEPKTLEEQVAALQQQLKDIKEKESQVSYENALKAQEALETYKKQLELVKEKKDEIADSDKIISDLQNDIYKTQVARFNILQREYLQLLEKQKLGKEFSTDDQERLDSLKDQTFELGRQLEKTQQEKKLKEEIKSLGNEIFQNIKQQTLALEQHVMKISVATGGYAAINSNLREAGRLSQAATLGTGITGEENLRALEALSSGFIGLTTNSAESISSMQVASSQLNKLGVDLATSTKGFDSLVNAMGKTPQQAAKIQESFVQMAAKNRLALGSVTQAFAENSSRFVGYGEQMTKVLDGLAEQSLKTGVAIGGLVKIAQQFDTFESAAKAVGNLNALLGGDYLNSIELLTASDDERIRLLKDGVAASGMQWDSMNRFQKMAVANAAGISDLNEAAKIFGKTSLENTKQQADAAAVQKTLAEQAESVSLGMDKLKSALNGVFIALEPVVSVFISIVSAMASVIQVFNSLLVSFGLGPQAAAVVTTAIVLMISKLGLLGKMLGLLGKMVSWVASSISARLVSSFTSLASTATPASASMATAITTIGGAARSAAAGLLVLAAAVALIGIGIGAAAYGMSYLVKSFKELGSEQISGALWSLTIVMGGFILAIGSLAAVAIFASAPIAGLAGALLAIGGAVALIGAGIGAAAAGIGYMVNGVTNLIVALDNLKTDNVDKLFDIFSKENIQKVTNFASAIAQLSSAMQSLGDNLAAVEIRQPTFKSVVENIENVSVDMKPQTASPASTSSAATGKSLIPASQTMVVPMVVQIDGKNFIEIFKKDIEKIAQTVAANESFKALDSVGIVQSAYAVQSIPTRG